MSSFVKKGMVLGAAVMTLGSLVAGCGAATNNTQQAADNKNANNTAATGNGPVDFSKASGSIVWAAPPITNNGLRKTLVDTFNKEHPNIKVTLQNQNTNTDTNRASLTTAIGGGATTPDVYMGDVVWPAQFAHSQLAMPLDKVLPADFWNRFANGLVDGAKYQGKVYAAPFFADTAFLFYRKDLLDKAGLPVPTSWEQVQKDAQTLQNKGLVKFGYVWQGASYEGLTCDFTEILADAGGKVLDSSGKPALDSPEAKKALSFMRGLITSKVSPAAEDTFKEPESMNVFNNGDAAFLRNWSYAWTSSQNPKDSKVVGKVGVTVLPTFGGGAGYSSVGGWDLFVNPHTKNVPATLAFIDWMTGKEAQTIMAKQFSEIPTNKDVQNDPNVKKVSPIFNIVSQTKFVSRPSQNPNYAQISQALYTNVNQALSGGISVDDALKKAQQAIQSSASSGGL
ncbi:ABC transporter substrate-binding protein [Fodinisporobacter ferrooxydans]|uniref:ABC transporter substrate-binding protein n=1 Tax=Fodinisporobacter ferrooxydans TaxID=2901836 RepID=A0ABY4CJQ4_9BACL|nr:ABC transporter substrate-binding protein [Alicyclobacillaceae bacterium MYW30-H2]